MPCTHALSVRLRVIGHVCAEVNVLKKIKQGKASTRNHSSQAPPRPPVGSEGRDTFWTDLQSLEGMVMKRKHFPPFPCLGSKSVK